MIAKYEKRTLTGQVHTSAHSYRNLQNLPHWHVEHELVFVACGSAEIMVNNDFYTLNEGCGAFVHSGEVHYIKSDMDSVIHVVKIDVTLVENIIGEMSLKTPLVENYYDFQGFFQEIFKELGENLEFNGVIVDSLVVGMVAKIFRGKEKISTDVSLHRGDRRYKELLKLISENFARITFEEAAEFMCFSEPYFSKYFRQLTGMKFTRYVNILKVSAAIDLIEEGEMSMTEIAGECGFNTIRSFNRVFKEITGYSPGNLPKGYVLIDNFRDFSSMDFDPTLNVTTILE